MKILKLFLLLFLYMGMQFTSEAATNWYVSSTIAGSANGTSWTNRASLSAFNWASVLSGDTVYIDGGNGSLTYTNIRLTVSGKTGIVVTRGKDNGHNGEPIFTITTAAKSPAVNLNNCTNVEISYLTAKSLATDAYAGKIFQVTKASSCKIDNNTILSNGNGFGLYMDGVDGNASEKITISNNHIETLPNTLNYGQDPIWIGNNKGGHTIIGNTLINNGHYSTSAHTDIIQMYNEGSPNNYEFVIANNLLLALNNSESSCQGLYTWDMTGNRFLIYNNIISMNTLSNSAITLKGTDAGTENLSARVFNNTMVLNNGSGVLFRDIDTAIVKNNIIYTSDATDRYLMIFGWLSINEITYKDVDYNQFYRAGGYNATTCAANGTAYSFANWQALGYDTHSNIGAITFTNLWGMNKEDYITPNGRDQGTSTSLFHSDIRDKARPQNLIWDKGALEFATASGDITPPRLLGATINNSTTVVLTFSEALDATSAVNNLNYSINNGVTVTSAALSTDKIKVTLTTSPHASGSYSVAVNNVKDLAGNVISGYNTAQYITDLTPPRLLKGILNNSTTVLLTFSEPLQSSATTISNFSINNGIIVSGATLSSDKIKVTLTTSAHTSGLSYSVTVSNVKDTSGNVIATPQNTAIYKGDFVRPNLFAAELVDFVKLKLTFSEGLDSISAKNIANYLITNGITIQNASMSADYTTVTLTTSPHTSGQTYTVTVPNVKDIAGNLIDVNIKAYSCTYDNIKPVLNSIYINSTKSLTVNFSEKVNTLKAININNYQISGGISIGSVQLLPDSSSVLLRTTAQSRYKDYTLTVTNITDRTGNLLNPNPTVKVYRLPKRISGLTVEYTVQSAISGTWNQNYLPNKTIDGKGMNNPDSRWMSNKLMPDTIDFNMGNSRSLDSMRISFYNWEAGCLYKYSVYSSVDSINWQPVAENIWSEDVEWSELEFDSVSTKYVKLVLLESNNSSFGSIWEFQVFGHDAVSGVNDNTEVPSEFKLAQNYPNPFNPSTVISVSLPASTHLKLAIYNILGEQVRELANGEFEKGLHQFNFNADGLASGTYIYRIESPGFNETKKMMLLR